MRKSFRGRRPKPEVTKEPRTNEKIFSAELMIIDENGENLGIMNREKALNEARERELDLVEVNPKANPPIAKFIDYGSFKYQKEKQERKAKAKQKNTEVKTIKISLRIGRHDLEIRADRALGFLKDGDKIKIEMQLRGRENQHVDIAKESIKELIDIIKTKLATEHQSDLKIEGEITKQGNRLSINISL